MSWLFIQSGRNLLIKGSGPSSNHFLISGSELPSLVEAAQEIITQNESEKRWEKENKIAFCPCCGENGLQRISLEDKKTEDKKMGWSCEYCNYKFLMDIVSL